MHAAAGAPAEPPPPPTAAIIVIGDEVLSGRVRDVNSAFLCAALAPRGVRVGAVLVVPDVVADIASAVRAAARAHAYVLTTGGLGPTHDDVTMAGIAAAFGVPLARHPALSALLHALARTRGGPDDHTLRMADVPAGPATRLMYADGQELVGVPPVEAAPADAAGAAAIAGGGGGDAAIIARGYPLVAVHNVFIFPGVPAILRRKWRAHEHLFTGPACAVREMAVHGAGETALAPCLAAFAASHPHLKLGSYPADEDTYPAAAAPAAVVAAAPASPSGAGSGRRRSGAPSPLLPPVAGAGTDAPPDVVLTLSASGEGADAAVDAGVEELLAALARRWESGSSSARAERVRRTVRMRSRTSSSGGGGDAAHQ